MAADDVEARIAKFKSLHPRPNVPVRMPEYFIGGEFIAYAANHALEIVDSLQAQLADEKRAQEKNLKHAHDFAARANESWGVQFREQERQLAELQARNAELDTMFHEAARKYTAAHEENASLKAALEKSR